MDNLQKIISEELKKERTNYLIESLLPLTEINEDELLVQTYFQKIGQLLDEGYSIEEIELISEESIGDKLSSGISSEVGGSIMKTGFLSSLLGGSISGLKEQILSFLARSLGAPPALAGAIGTFFEDVGVRDLILPFKSKQYCVQVMPKISVSLAEAFINYAQFGNTVPTFTGKDVFKIELRNVIADSVKESTLGTVIANKICSVIWKE